jgi:AcrR family transcriptional regulator
VIEHFAADGLADQSLRRIAEAVGTSHRMLLYHFGSKDGLMLAVVREVEERTKAQFLTLGEGAGPEQTEELVRSIWQYVADPALGDFERLFFALYGRALQGDESFRPLLKENIETWLEANATFAVAAGLPVERFQAHARLGLAVTRGLLLDLLATGDRTAVEGALEVFAARYRGRWWDEGQTEGCAAAQATSVGRGRDTSDEAS